MLYVCGSNNAGQLGVNGGFVQHSPTLLSMPDQNPVSSIAAGHNCSAAVTTGWSFPHPSLLIAAALCISDLVGHYAGGGLYTWGAGDEGRLGHESGANCSLPTRVSSLESVRVVAVACGMYHMAARDDQGQVWTWGSGSYGQLGLGEGVESSAVPAVVPIPEMDGEKEVGRCAGISCGASHTVVYTDQGYAYSWGYAGDGQLGHGNKKRCSVPCRVVALDPSGLSDDKGADQIVWVGCGWRHTAAVTQRGKLLTWGWGKGGRLGHGDSEDVTTPKEVERLGGKVKAASCGVNHTAVVVDLEPEALAEAMERDRRAMGGRLDKDEDPQLRKDMESVRERFESELNGSSDSVEASSEGIRGIQDSFEAAQKERDALFARLESAQNRKVSATALELRMRNAIAEAHKTWGLLEETHIGHSRWETEKPNADQSTIVQAAKDEVDLIVAEFRQRVMGEDNAALVAAEAGQDEQWTAAAVDFLQRLVEIVEDNGEMRKRVYHFTEALQRETMEKMRRFEEQMQGEEEAGEFEKFKFKLTNLFEDD